MRRIGGTRASCIQLHETRLGLIDGQQLILEDDALGRVRPGQIVDPLAVRAGPVASREMQTTAQQRLAEPIAPELAGFPWAALPPVPVTAE